ncbi:MAG: hypothetical protein MUC31_09130 [Bacteroidales bacterium]|nr:hypothetical protein [Bacteroidales bacterium]
MMIFGPVSYLPGKGMMSRFQSLEFAALVASGAGAAGAGHPFMCNGACLAYRKSAFLEVKGFEGNEKYLSGDDVFLLHKMKKTFGRKSVVFARAEEAMAMTSPEAGLIAFIRQRMRWASKSRGYRDPVAAFTAISVFSFNLLLAATFIAGIFHPPFFLLFAGFLLFKSVTDLPLVTGIARFTRAVHLLYWYLPFQVLYPFYTALAGIFSMFGRRKW